MSNARGPPLDQLVDSGDPDELFELIDEIAQVRSSLAVQLLF